MEKCFFLNEIMNTCIQNKDFEMALKCAEESISGFTKNYPPFSPLPLLQHALAAKMSNYLENPLRSKEHLMICIPGLSNSHGSKHSLVVELYDLLDDVNREIESLK